MNKLLIICILIIGVIFISGCTSISNTEKRIDSGNSANLKTVVMDSVSINSEILKSQGWNVEELPEFYDSSDFLYYTNSPRTVYLLHNSDGDIDGILAVIKNKDYFESTSLTVNEITFNNFVVKDKWLMIDIENPIDKKITYQSYKLLEDIEGRIRVEGRSKPFEIDHSKQIAIGNTQYFISGYKVGVLSTDLLFPPLVIYIQFLPTPKRGEKIIQTTEWFPLEKEQNVQLPKFGTIMEVEQLRPRGDVIFTAKLDDSDGTTLYDVGLSYYHIILFLDLKTEDGKIINLGRRDLSLSTSGGRTVFTTTEKIVSWRATIEFTPLIVE